MLGWMSSRWPVVAGWGARFRRVRAKNPRGLQPCIQEVAGNDPDQKGFDVWLRCAAIRRAADPEINTLNRRARDDEIIVQHPS
jgi:hypothetical protein